MKKYTIAEWRERLQRETGQDTSMFSDRQLSAVIDLWERALIGDTDPFPVIAESVRMARITADTEKAGPTTGEIEELLKILRHAGASDRQLYAVSIAFTAARRSLSMFPDSFRDHYGTAGERLILAFIPQPKLLPTVGP